MALAAIQGLNQKVEDKDTRIRELEQRIEKLERLISLSLHHGEKEAPER